MSARSGEVVRPSLSTNDDPQHGGVRESWRAERLRRYPSDTLYNLPEFHGLVWFAGQSEAVPVFAPPYWDAKHNPDLQGRYDPDPYHAGSTGGVMSRASRQIGRVAGVAALLAVLLIGAHLLGF
jgi:hypothetical protein